MTERTSPVIKALKAKVDIKIEETEVSNPVNDYDMHNIHIKQEEHTNTDASELKSYCKHCKLDLQSPSLYTSHMEVQHKLDPTSLIPFCHLCEFTYAGRNKYREHLRVVHKMTFPLLRPKHDPSIQPDPNDPNFFCRSCNSDHHKKGEYFKHLRTKHKMGVWCFNKKRITSDVEPDPKDPNYFCKSCNKSFAYKYNLGRHMMILYGVNAKN